MYISRRDHNPTTGSSNTDSPATQRSRIRRRRQPDGSFRREGRLLSLMGTSYEGDVYVSDVYIAAAHHLAWKHLQTRDGSVLPDLPDLLKGCDDFDWTYEQRETYYDPVAALQGLVAATTVTATMEVAKSVTKSRILEQHRDLVTVDVFHNSSPRNTTTSFVNSTLQQSTNAEKKNDIDETGLNLDANNGGNLEPQFPFGIVGAAYSYVTLPLTIVGSALELPMMSGSATSAALDEYPDQRLFGRTIPTNAGDANAAMLYYESIGVHHIAVIYIKDAWGTYYHADLKREASQHGIVLESIPYTEDASSIRAAMIRLKESQFRYVFAIMYDWKTVLEEAHDCGVVGVPEYSWIAAELVEWTDPEFALNRTIIDDTQYDDEEVIMDLYEREYKQGRALNGIGQLAIDVPYHERFANAMDAFAASPEQRQEFLNQHADPTVWKSLRDSDWAPPDSSLYQQMNYDAVIAMGLAACQTPGLFSTEDFYNTLRGISFEGTTGNVTFDARTGSRNVESVRYRVDTIYVSNLRSDQETLRFDSHLASIISQGQVQHLLPFRYADNTTTAPPELPIIEYEYNLVPLGAQIYAWMVAGLVIGFGLLFLVWTYTNRKKFVVQASQPFFLIQLCVGTLLMASAVIPMSFQATDKDISESPELERRLDIGCMFVPWLVLVGLVVALSALSSKAWRLNQLMKAGMRMRRIEVQPSDVMGPFVILMSINVALLLGWTLIAPLRYVRIPKTNIDRFGRNIESYGVCQSETSSSLYFLVPLLIVNFIGLTIATYQSYQGRNYATAISESRYLAISMASLLETLLLGGPIILVLRDNPSASFVVRSTILCVSCMTIMVPVFLPKYYHSDREPAVATSSSIHISRKASITSDVMVGSTRPGFGDGTVMTPDFSTEQATQSADSTEWGKMKINRLNMTGSVRTSMLRNQQRSSQHSSGLRRNQISLDSSAQNNHAPETMRSPRPSQTFSNPKCIQEHEP